jgi:hypothetical protein
MGQPGMIQSYAQFAPKNNMDGKFDCDYYVSIKDYNTPKRDSKPYKQRV